MNRIIIGILLVMMAGCNNPASPTKTNPLPVEAISNPYTWGGPYEGECFDKELEKPMCGDGVTAICSKHQDGAIVTGYSWLCIPDWMFVGEPKE